MNSHLKIGDDVSIPVRFGESGKIIEIDEKGNRYAVEFDNLPFTLWYNKNELQLLQPGDKKIKWFRMKNEI